MARLIYFSPISLDGFIADESGSPEWSAPDEEVFTFITGLQRTIGKYLYGRKMYQTMAIWDTPEVIPGVTPALLEFARIWQAAEKVVYSSSLATAPTSRTRIERVFQPHLVHQWKAESALDLSVAGPTLAAQAIRAGLVDEYQLLVVPTMLGGGTRVLPGDAAVRLRLLDARSFANGMVYLRYERKD